MVLYINIVPYTAYGDVYRIPGKIFKPGLCAYTFAAGKCRIMAQVARYS